MAKTIEEMANLAWPQQANDDFEAMTFKASKRKAFCQGAAVVLDELKTRLKEYKTNSLGEYFVAWDYINEIINELKG